MALLTILHLSDLHWTEAKATDMRIVVNALCADLQHLSKNKNIRPDLIVFTGDLVLAGEDSSAFQSARSNFIEPILSATDLPKDSFFIVPGNHDVSRKAVRANAFLEAGALATLSSDESLNQFIDKLDGNDVASMRVIERSTNFYQFVRGEFDCTPIIDEPLLRMF